MPGTPPPSRARRPGADTRSRPEPATRAPSGSPGDGRAAGGRRRPTSSAIEARGPPGLPERRGGRFRGRGRNRSLSVRRPALLLALSGRLWVSRLRLRGGDREGGAASSEPGPAEAERSRGRHRRLRPPWVPRPGPCRLRSAACGGVPRPASPARTAAQRRGRGREAWRGGAAPGSRGPCREASSRRRALPGDLRPRRAVSPSPRAGAWIVAEVGR